MGWKSIRGQDAALDLLRRDLSSGQVAGAYMFYGPDGVGKASAARLFAQALQCPGEAPPCGGCIACEKVGANVASRRRLHPSGRRGRAPSRWS